MKLAYLYNEILPTRRAHDAYIWRNCVSLARAGIEVHLACGKGSLAAQELATHYLTTLPTHFFVKPLTILRRNFSLPFTWNRVFNGAAQRFLQLERPDRVLLSVRKQGLYHLERKLTGVLYVYEVHELEWYPTLGKAAAQHPHVMREREMLSKADLLTVTTEALRRILVEPPYSLRNRVVVVPLAIEVPTASIPIVHSLPLHAMYIGQLYAGQGVEDFVAAVAQVPDVVATIVGGSPEDLARVKASVPPHAVSRIRFTGFLNPVELPGIASKAHVLVAPFRPERRMPFVAHTKLLEYAALQRPVVAPELPIVSEHFKDGAGLCTYPPGDRDGLAASLKSLVDPILWGSHYLAAREAHVTTWEDRAAIYFHLLESLG